jgi:hypothetical protein
MINPETCCIIIIKKIFLIKIMEITQIHIIELIVWWIFRIDV